MSMIGMFLQITPATLEEILNDSAVLENIIDELITDYGTDMIDVDKAWDGIHFLLTGNSLDTEPAHPLRSAILGTYTVDENQDLGYGPANYLPPAEVREMYESIEDIGKEDLKKHYNGKRMDALEVYPGIWSDEAVGFDYLWHHFEKLKEFYQDAATKENAVVMFIS